MTFRLNDCYEFCLEFCSPVMPSDGKSNCHKWMLRFNIIWQFVTFEKYKNSANEKKSLMNYKELK